MSGKTFVDTNFLIYSLDAGNDKARKALHILDTEPGLMLSTQVIGESVCNGHGSQGPVCSMKKPVKSTKSRLSPGL